MASERVSTGFQAELPKEGYFLHPAGHLPFPIEPQLLHGGSLGGYPDLPLFTAQCDLVLLKGRLAGS